MADIPQDAPIHTQKRPLEETSSPSGPNDQPDAKRPALDKVLKEDDAPDVQLKTELATVAKEESKPDGANDDAKVEDATVVDAKVAATETDKQGDTVVPDAPTNGSSAAPPVPQAASVQSPTATNGRRGDRAGSEAPYHHQDETGWLHVRAIISSAEAATVIGKGGENVSQIRRIAGAKCTVSEYSRGAVERILTVSGLVDAVAKVSCPRINYMLLH